jgi:RNase P protein component
MTAPAFVNNAADKNQTRGARRKMRTLEQSATRDFAAVLSTPEGRRFVWRLLGKDFLKLYETDLAATDSQTIRNAGRRNVALRLYAELTEQHPDAYLLMQREAIDAVKAAAKDEPEKDLDTELRSEDTTDG